VPGDPALDGVPAALADPLRAGFAHGLVLHEVS
jgi:hypothetical protein